MRLGHLLQWCVNDSLAFEGAVLRSSCEVQIADFDLYLFLLQSPDNRDVIEIQGCHQQGMAQLVHTDWGVSFGISTSGGVVIGGFDQISNRFSSFCLPIGPSGSHLYHQSPEKEGQGFSMID